MGILCVSVDLDEIHCYHKIHGMGPPQSTAGNAVYQRALPRVARFLEEQELTATLFAVGSDLSANREGSQILRDLVGRGCEIGNHTLNHRYDLTLLRPDEQVGEIEGGAAAIAQAVGVLPSGFRAPGYNIHLGLLDLLADREYAYDSSVFPCPLYYVAKAGALGLAEVVGRQSAAIIGDPRALLSPAEPYRTGRDGVWTKGDGICELPISVVTPLRVPFIGTSLSLLGRIGSAVLARSAARLRFINLELHGIDFLDAESDGLGYLASGQSDLKVPFVRKREIFARVIRVLVDSGMEPMCLADAASRVFV